MMFQETKAVIKSRPVASLLIGSFIVIQMYFLTSLAISDVTSHPGYVLLKALFLVLGALIWVSALKTGKFGQASLQYIGFCVLSGVVQFIAHVISYGNSTPHGIK